MRNQLITIAAGALTGAAILAGGASALPPADPPGFLEDFDAPALDPAWSVVEYTGPRSHYQPFPANHFVLGASPGSLRYFLDPVTHADGFVNGYTVVGPGGYSSAWHDPGLELLREFSGEHWVLDAKATYYLPYSNGRSFDLRVYFGDGSPGTYFAALARGRECCGPSNWYALLLRQQTGTSVLTINYLESVSPPSPWDASPSGPSITEVWWRLVRDGGLLTAYWSLDGSTYTAAYAHDLGSALDGLPQTVALAGHSWFNSAGSWVDWDYVHVVPTTVPVDIDIRPGSDPNPVNPASNGKIPVAVLGGPDLDVADIVVASLAFGPAGAAPAHGGHFDDVNLDGYVDLVVHFSTRATGIAPGDTQACLTGELSGDLAIAGCDEVRTVGR